MNDKNETTITLNLLQIPAAYFQDGDYNIVSVDYGKLAPEPCYLQAVQNLPLVARCTAQLLDAIVTLRQIALADWHVIGFSLGAQTAGMISNYVRMGRLHRITGEAEICMQFAIEIELAVAFVH